MFYLRAALIQSSAVNQENEAGIKVSGVTVLEGADVYSMVLLQSIEVTQRQ